MPSFHVKQDQWGQDQDQDQGRQDQDQDRNFKTQDQDHKIRSQDQDQDLTLLTLSIPTDRCTKRNVCQSEPNVLKLTRNDA